MYSTASNLNAFLKQETRTLLVLDEAHNFPVPKLVTSNVGFNC
jgi:superfamily II DNA or RNA helicase